MNTPTTPLHCFTLSAEHHVAHLVLNRPAELNTMHPLLASASRAPLERRLRLLGVRVGALQWLEQAVYLEPNQPLGPAETGVIATNSEADDPWTGQLF